MEKENVGEGKERVLREKICNRVLEEQNMEKENVGRGRGRGRVCVTNFVTMFQKVFTMGLKLKRL